MRGSTFRGFCRLDPIRHPRLEFNIVFVVRMKTKDSSPPSKKCQYSKNVPLTPGVNTTMHLGQGGELNYFVVRTCVCIPFFLQFLVHFGALI